VCASKCPSFSKQRFLQIFVLSEALHETPPLFPALVSGSAATLLLLLAVFIIVEANERFLHEVVFGTPGAAAFPVAIREEGDVASGSTAAHATVPLGTPHLFIRRKQP
jgi:hypothetical protein